jgi:hypothetical protein
MELPSSLNRFSIIDKNFDNKLKSFAESNLSDDVIREFARAPLSIGEAVKEHLFLIYARVREEEKIEVGAKCAAFNTGLVDRYKNPVIAVFRRNTYKSSGDPEWELFSLTVPGTAAWAFPAGEGLPIPEKANFPYSLSDERFNPELWTGKVSLRHIIADNNARLPQEFYRKHFPELEEVKAGDSLQMEVENRKLRESLKLQHSERSQVWEAAAEDFRKHVDRAMEAQKTADRSFAAFPVWYARHSELQFLVPLRFEESRPSEWRALAVGRRGMSGEYYVRTVLTYDMALLSVRGLCWRKGSWLWEYGRACPDVSRPPLSGALRAMGMAPRSSFPKKAAIPRMGEGAARAFDDTVSEWIFHVFGIKAL